MYTNHPHGNQYHKGPICLWVVGEVTENRPIADQMALFPLGPLPYIQHHNTAMRVALPRRIPKALPLTSERPWGPKKKAQMKEHIKDPEKIQLSDEETAKL